MANYDALRAALTEMREGSEQAAAPKPAEPAAIVAPLLEQRVAEQRNVEATLPLPGRLPMTELPEDQAPPPEVPQPQTVVGAAKQADKEERGVAKRPNPLRPSYTGLTADLTGAPTREIDVTELQTLDEVEAVANEVFTEITVEQERRKGDWFNFDQGNFAAAVNFFMNVADVTEDAARAIITAYNTVGPDINVPGMSDENTQAALEATKQAFALKEEVRLAGLNDQFLHIDRSPQGNMIGIDYWTSWDLFKRDYELRLRTKIIEDTGSFTKENWESVQNEAAHYADKTMHAIVAGKVGRNFPVLKREEVPGETARWIRTYPPAIRPVMTGIWQDNATIVMPNGEVFEQDLTQNTLFGALDYGFNLISPTAKPFAAGAHTGRTLTGADLRTYMKESFMPEPILFPMIVGLADNIPDFDTGIPFDIDSPEAIQHMMEGRADLVTHHDQLGGALARKMLEEPNANDSLFKQGVNDFSRRFMWAIGGTWLADRWGWTDAELLGVALTGGAAILEPDGFGLLGPLGKGAKIASEMKNASKAARVLNVTGDALKIIDDADKLSDISPARMAKALEGATGVQSGHIIDLLYHSRVNELAASDPDLIEFAVEEARAFQDSLKNLTAAEAAEKAANSPRLKALAAYDAEVARMNAAGQHANTMEFQSALYRLSPTYQPNHTYVRADALNGLRSAQADQIKYQQKISKISAAHGNRLKAYKDAAKLRNDMRRDWRLIQDESRRMQGLKAQELTTIGGELRALGIEPPTTSLELRKLIKTQADPKTAAVLKRYKVARDEAMALRRQYAALVAKAKTDFDDAQDALRAYAGMDKIQANLMSARRSLHAAANDAAKYSTQINIIDRVDQVKMLDYKIAESRKVEKAAKVKSGVLKGEVLKSARSAPSNPKNIAYLETLGDQYLRYAKQAMREIVEGVRDGHEAISKVQDIDYGAADDVLRASSDFNPAMERVFDGAQFTEEFKKVADPAVINKLRPGEQDLINRAMRGDTFIGEDVADLKRAINRAARFTISGDRTPIEEMGLAFWRSMDDPNVPVWGRWPAQQARTWFRKTVAAFGIEARISEVAPQFGRTVVESQRNSKLMQQEIYEVLTRPGGTITDALEYLDTTAGMQTRGGMTRMNQGDRTLFAQFTERVKNLAEVHAEILRKPVTEDLDASEARKMSELIDEARDVQAVVRSFMPDGIEISGEDAAAVYRAVLRTFIDRPPKTAASLYAQLPAIVARTLADRRGGQVGEYMSAALRTRNKSSNIAGFTAGIAQGAVMNRAAKDIGSIILGRHSVEDVQAANNLMNGKIGTAADVDAAVRVLNEMEMAINPRGGGRLGEAVRDLVVLQNSKDGVVFAPKVVIDEINNAIDGMVKELHAIHTAERVPPQLNVVFRFLGGALRAVQLGLVRGYIIPRFKRFTNATFQNYAQIWAEEGMSVATQVAVKAAPAMVSWAAPKLLTRAAGKIQTATSEALGGIPVFGSFLASLANPHSGRIFAGETGTMVLNGRSFSYDELRKLASDYGIMENTLRSELGPQLADLMRRRRAAGFTDVPDPDKLTAAEKARWLSGKAIDQLSTALQINSDWVTRAVETMEQRQRMEMFLTMLDRGLDVEQAAKRVEGALYDWSTPMAHWEVELIANQIPFYRVFRNSGAHAVRMLTEPFTAPTGDYMRRAAFGQTRLGRSRAQHRLASLYARESDLDPNTEGRQTIADIRAADLIAPGYWGGRTPGKMSLMNRELAAKLEERTGQRFDQVLTMHPNLSTLEGLDMVGNLIAATMAVTIVALDNAGALAGVTSGDTTLPADFKMRTLSVFLDYGGLATPEVLDAIGAIMDSEEAKMADISLGEAQAWNWTNDILPYGWGPRQRLDGTWEMNKMTRAIAGYIPLLGPQWQDVMKAYYDKSVSDTELGRYWEVFRHMVGDSRQYYSYSEEEQNKRANALSREIKNRALGAKNPRMETF